VKLYKQNSKKKHQNSTSAGQLNYWRQNSVGQLEELQSVGLSVGGTSVKESSQYQSFIYTSHTDPVLRLWTLNDLRKPIKRYFIKFNFKIHLSQHECRRIKYISIRW
jgi:hypothetical protein